MFGRKKKVIPVQENKPVPIPVIKSEEELYESQTENNLDDDEIQQEEEDLDLEEEKIKSKIKQLEEKQKQLKAQQEEKVEKSERLSDEVIRNTFYNLDLRLRGIEDWIIRIKNL